ncbi:ABC transporter ATP-binding protein [Patescibacteria group bacterium]
MESKHSIAISKLSKHYGHLHAVKNVNLMIKRGDIFALVGPNGAGKTTLVKMMIGLEEPTEGNISLLGLNFYDNPVFVKKKFGYVSDNPTAYPFLSALEFLTFCGRLRQMTVSDIKERISYLTSIFPIDNILEHPMGDYSRGNKQKIAILSALLSEPEILIIDEPIVGLDPESIGILGKLVKEYAKKGNTVFFITHILKFALDNAKHIGVMKKGVLTEVSDVTKSTNFEKLL